MIMLWFKIFITIVNASYGLIIFYSIANKKEDATTNVIGLIIVSIHILSVIGIWLWV